MLPRLSVLVLACLATSCATVNRAELSALCPGVAVPRCSSDVDCAQDKARGCFVCTCTAPVLVGPFCTDRSNPGCLPNLPEGAAATRGFPETYESPAQRALR